MGNKFSQFGYDTELSTRLSNRLYNGEIAPQGKADTKVRFLINGKIRYLACEVKTNGGRIDTLINGTNKAKYVIYAMDLCNSTTSNKRRIIEKVIIPTDLFLAKLKEFKAIKTVSHNGTVDGLAIQPSNKKWYEWLLDYPMTFDISTTWSVDDFDGLE